MSTLLTASKDGAEFAVRPHSGIVVNHRPHPFDLKREVLELPEGLTLQEYIEAAQPDAAIRACFMVRLQGHVIPRENWRVVRPKPGMIIEAVPLPAGGETMRTVLMIAIVAAAMAAGGWAAGGLVTAGYLAAGGAGVTFAAAGIGGALPLGGPLCLAAMLPPPGIDPKVSHDGTRDELKAGRGGRES